MRPTSTSRFSDVTFVKVIDDRGIERLVDEVRENQVGFNDLGDQFSVVRTVEGTQLDAVAFDFAGDARFWWVIADLNQDNLDDLLRVPVNTRLITPTEEFFTRRGQGLA